MPRCNLTLKQKSQIIELSGKLSTELIARKFHVHPTTVTRTIKKKSRILDQASRVNTNFKTVQTNRRSEEHDALVLNYIKERQELEQTISIKDICDKAIEFGQLLDRHIKSRRGWWRRFKTRCQIIRSRIHLGDSNNNSNKTVVSSTKNSTVLSTKKKKVYTFKVRESTAGHVTTNTS